MPDARLLLAAFGLCYALLTLLSRTRHRREGSRTCEAVLFLGGRRAAFRVLRDTGNCLTDPVTGAEVMIVSPRALSPLLPEQAALFSEADPVALLERAEGIPALRGRLRLIACGGVGGRSLLPLLRPDRAEIGGEEKAGLLAAISANAEGDGFEGIY